MTVIGVTPDELDEVVMDEGPACAERAGDTVSDSVAAAPTDCAVTESQPVVSADVKPSVFPIFAAKRTAQAAGLPDTSLIWAKLRAKWTLRTTQQFLDCDEAGAGPHRFGVVKRSSVFQTKVFIALQDKLTDVASANDQHRVRVDYNGAQPKFFLTVKQPAKAISPASARRATAACAKFYFAGPIGISVMPPSLPLAKLVITDNNEVASFDISGAITPSVPIIPSLAWYIPTSSDDADCTMNLETESIDVSFSIGNIKEKQIMTLHYLQIKDTVLADAKTGSEVQLIRPVLAREDARGLAKMQRTAVTVTSLKTVIAELFPHPAVV